MDLLRRPVAVLLLKTGLIHYGKLYLISES